MFPKMGNKLHPIQSDLAFARLMSEALAAELGRTHAAIKTAMRWTGASERTVKHWLAGTHAPRGAHLLGLVRHSDQVLIDFLQAAGRDDLLFVVDLLELRLMLRAMLDRIDGQVPDGGGQL